MPRKKLNPKHYSITVFNPMGRERQISPDKSIKITIKGVMYRIRIDSDLDAVFISKLGHGVLRGKVDRIGILPASSHDFLIK